jgi:hypothetical protein
MIFCGWWTQWYCPGQDTIRVGAILYIVSGHTAIERIGDEIGIALDDERTKMIPKISEQYERNICDVYQRSVSLEWNRLYPGKLAYFLPL